MKAAQIDRAAMRIARMFGFGGAWRAEVNENSIERDRGVERSRDDDREDFSGSLAIAWRGHVTEQAARRIDGCPHVRRQHAWALNRAVIALPLAAPDPMGQAALSFAKLRGPHEPLLISYAIESVSHWYRAERFLHAKLPHSPYVTIAGRDAMARIMYRFAAISIDDRARELGIRAASYRNMTWDAEILLRKWLIDAAVAFNRVADARSARPARPKRTGGFRSQSLWNDAEYKRILNAGRISTLQTTYQIGR